MAKKNISRVFVLVLVMCMVLAGCTTGNNTSSTGSTASEPKSEASTSDTSTGSETSIESEVTPTGEKIIRVNNSSEPGSLHPALAQGTHDSWPLNHMFEGLYEKNAENGTDLAVAESVETSEDGLTWTFKISPDAKWSNGDQVTANDFISSFAFCLDPKNAAKYSTQLYILENAEAINSGEKDISELGAKALDEMTLELKLVNPLPYLPDLLTHYTFYPVHTKNQEENPNWYTSPENYISNGAFVLTEWKNKESITLKKNTNFRRASDVKLDGMYFTIIEDIPTTWQMFESGDLDALYPLPPAVIEKLDAEDDPVLNQFDDLSTYYYYFNTTRKPFNNVKVRQALSMSINRDALTKNVTKGGEVPAFSLTCPGISDGNGDFQENLGPLFSENLEEAKKLLEEGLAEEGMTKDEFSFKILYNTNDTHKKVAEAIQAMWIQNLEVKAELENAEFQVVLDRRKAGDFDVCRAGWIGDYSDPMTFVELFTTYSEFNDCKWESPEYDALIKTAQETMDNDVRMNAMKDAEKLLAADMPIMPIYFYKKNWAISEKVTGYFTPVNRYVLLYYADIEQ